MLEGAKPSARGCITISAWGCVVIMLSGSGLSDCLLRLCPEDVSYKCLSAHWMSACACECVRGVLEWTWWYVLPCWGLGIIQIESLAKSVFRKCLIVTWVYVNPLRVRGSNVQAQWQCVHLWVQLTHVYLLRWFLWFCSFSLFFLKIILPFRYSISSDSVHIMFPR